MPILDGEQRRKAINELGRSARLLQRDITADYPEFTDEENRERLERREACERDLRLFLETYFPFAFNMGWSDDHLRVIERLQAVVLEGGLYALAMPRGQGKTTLSVRAAMWSLLYGHRRFICLIGATEKKAQDLLKQIKTELSFNELLLRGFRQVCYPIKRLENNGRLAIGQLFDGQETRIDWSVDRLTFPTMPDWACDGANVSGYAVSVAGLTGSIRGQSHTLVSGEIIRPELAILDDPQTRESASSAVQNQTRAEIIKGDVLGMAGPGKRIAAVMPCTVIRAGDMADQMLDRKKNPEWSGLKTRMVYSFPDNMKLWEEYRSIFVEDMEAERGTKRATAFYRKNRVAMDAGAKVAWTARYDKKTEFSAVQHAMNLRFLDENAFFAEYQNDPRVATLEDREALTADQVAAKVNRIPPGIMPLSAQHVTAMIDVQANLLYYVVAAWEDDFTGYVLDYGTFPDQKQAYFTLREARNTLAKTFPKAGSEGRIFSGLEALTDLILSREWSREDGAVFRIAKCLIDSGYATDTILRFCRQSKYAGIVAPSKGMGLKPASRPFLEYVKRPGDRVGHHWRLPVATGRQVRQVLMDANYWKSFLHARLAVVLGDKGCLSLYGDKPARHRLFADHLTSETCDRQFSATYGRWVDVWAAKAGNPDNHWFDALVGCAVAASMQGAALAESKPVAPAVRTKVSFAELQRRRQQPAARP